MEKIIGKKIVGYRYGKAPASGKSYNYREGCYECGVSMACVGYYKEIMSFALDELSDNEKYYYEGVICGEGGDDEICLSNVRQITYNEYKSLLPKYTSTSNDYVNALYDRKVRLLDRGYIIGKSYEDVEHERKKYIK